jgi:hypothetical protein
MAAPLIPIAGLAHIGIRSIVTRITEIVESAATYVGHAKHRREPPDSVVRRA